MVLQGAINQLGSDIVAAYTAGTKVEQFFTMPTMTLGRAIATFAGQIERVKQGVKQSLVITLSYSIVGDIILYMFGGAFTSLFVSGDSQVVIDASVEYLHIVAIFCWLLAILFLYRSTIQGLGNGIIPMISGGIELVMRVIVALVLSQIIGFTSICLASPIAWLGADILLLPYYHFQIKKLSKQYQENPMIA